MSISMRYLTFIVRRRGFIPPAVIPSTDIHRGYACSAPQHRPGYQQQAAAISHRRGRHIRFTFQAERQRRAQRIAGVGFCLELRRYGLNGLLNFNGTAATTQAGRAGIKIIW